MKVLKLKIHQKVANYRIPNTIENKMTYPLPPFSSIIGAIHNACGWSNYHELKIGVIGKFDSLTNNITRYNSLLDNRQNDRGILTKLPGETFSPFLTKNICSAVKQEANFKKGKDTIFLDKKAYQNYLDLQENIENEKKFYKNQDSELKKKKKELKEQKKEFQKKSEQFVLLNNEIEVIDEKIKKLNKKRDSVLSDLNNQLNSYYTYYSYICHTEILNNVELILYISALEEDLEVIQENLCNITSIGRSEDFINIIDYKIIELKENIDETMKNKEGWNSYIDYKLINNFNIIISDVNENNLINTTVYRINKDYKIIDGKRDFNQKKVVCVSDYIVEESCENIYIDDTETDSIFIVNLL